MNKKHQLLSLLLFATVIALASSQAQENQTYSSIPQNFSTTSVEPSSSYSEDSPLPTTADAPTEITVHLGDIFYIDYSGFSKTARSLYWYPRGTVFIPSISYGNVWWSYHGGVPAVKQILALNESATKFNESATKFQAVKLATTCIYFKLSPSRAKLTWENGWYAGPTETDTITVTVIP